MIIDGMEVKISPEADILMKSTSEFTKALVNFTHEVQGMHEDTTKIKDLLSNGFKSEIISDVKNNFKNELNILYYKFAGTIIVIAGLIEIILRIGGS